MNTLFRTGLFALALVMGVSGATEVRAQFGLVPQYATTPIPKLGFNYVEVNGGLQITWVRPGSLAASIGLEVGDMIMALNGVPMTNGAIWDQAMMYAAQQGGNVYLVIRDVRTGNPVSRSLNVLTGQQQPTPNPGIVNPFPPANPFPGNPFPPANPFVPNPFPGNPFPPANPFVPNPFPGNPFPIGPTNPPPGVNNGPGANLGGAIGALVDLLVN